VSRPSGLALGFDTFDDPFAAGNETTSQARTERPASEVVDAALAWLGRPHARPFFVWVHLFDPHAPYEPPAPFRQRFKDEPYDGEIAYADAQFGRLLAWLDAKGLREATLVVATSDHGESLGEHGEDEHMFFVYDSTLHVPLILSWPGRLAAQARVTGQFRSVDLFSTLLELAGVAAPPTSGTSRAADLKPGGRIPDNESYAETLYPQLHFGYAPLRALRAEGWKYIEAPHAELYRLQDDPGEARNVVRERASVADAIRGRLLTYDRQAAAPQALPQVSAEAAERLAALGYVGGGLAPGEKPSGADPKDKVQEVQRFTRDMREGLRLYRDRDLDGAIRLLEPLAASGIDSFNVHYYLGRSLLERRRFAEAVPHLKAAADSAPTRRTLSGLAAAPIYAYLVEAYAGAGRMAEALETVRQALTVAPENPELQRARGRILLEQGDLAGARAALEKARALAPAEARVHVDLANLYRNLGDLPRARTEAREALRLDLKSPEAHVAQGLVLGATGKEDAAAEAFRQALRLAPDDPDALFYLGSVELRAGRAEVALPLLTKLVEKAPDYPEARTTLELARKLSAPLPEGTMRLRLLRVGDRQKADRVAARLAAGADFAALAQAESSDASASRGGDLGPVNVADLAEPLRAAAQALAPGQVSPVLETSGGYILLKRDR